MLWRIKIFLNLIIYFQKYDDIFKVDCPSIDFTNDLQGSLIKLEDISDNPGN